MQFSRSHAPAWERIPRLHVDWILQLHCIPCRMISVFCSTTASSESVRAMRLLLIKQSSLGDLIHCFPAISDAKLVLPSLHIDWLVESNFVEIPQWHKGIDQVIPFSVRQAGMPWQKRWYSRDSRRQRNIVKSRLQDQAYDLVIDAQGLMKSALLATWAKSTRIGFDAASIRKEKLAAWYYHRKVSVPLGLHAIERNRQLFEKSLNYRRANDQLDFQINHQTFASVNDNNPYSNRNQGLPQQTYQTEPYIIGFHATAWKSKHWPIQHWIDLGRLLVDQGLSLYLPRHNESERLRAGAH